MRTCIYAIENNMNNFAYCLKIKEWINVCPTKCSFFESGDIAKFNDIQKEYFNLECIYCTRINNDQLNHCFYCKLLENEKPNCESCLFPSYPIAP